MIIGYTVQNDYFSPTLLPAN